MASIGTDRALGAPTGHRRGSTEHRHHHHHHQASPPTPPPPPSPPVRRSRAQPAVRRDPVPTTRELHILLNRMGCGFRGRASPSSAPPAARSAWFEQQLDPELGRPRATRAAAVAGWFPRLQDAPAEIMANDATAAPRLGVRPRPRQLLAAASGSTPGAPCSSRWSSSGATTSTSTPSTSPAFTQRAAYDATIRHARARHVRGAARRRRAAPGDADVPRQLEVGAATRRTRTRAASCSSCTRSAGSRLHRGDGQGLGEDPLRLDRPDGRLRRRTTTPTGTRPGAVTVLGFTVANAIADDPELAARLPALPRAPPGDGAADRPQARGPVRHRHPVRRPWWTALAATYLDSGTDIKATLRALVGSDEFWASAGQKVRTPDRRRGRHLPGARRPRAGAGRRSAPSPTSSSWTLASTLVYQWPRPDGPPDRAAVLGLDRPGCSTPGGCTGAMAGGWWPNGEVDLPHRRVPSCPQPGIRFDELVDHLSRVLLGRRSTSRLLKAACEGCDVAARGADHRRRTR